MARARSAGVEVSLFPFLSILAALIGCLTLIIVSLTIIQLNQADGRPPEEVEVARAYVQIDKQKDEAAKKIEELKVDIENMIQKREDLDQKREKLKRMQDMLDSKEEVDSLRDELIVKLNLLINANKRLDIDHDELLKSIAALKEEIEKRKLPPDPPKLIVQAAGSGGTTEPYFVEIADKTILIHTSLSQPPVSIPSASMNTNEDFVKLLQKISEQPYRTLIFLVRGNEGSINNLSRATQLVSNFNQSNSGHPIYPARIPLPGEGKVDLSVFAQYLEP